MARRSKAREVALQMLYQQDLNSDVDAQTVREMIEEQIPEQPLRAFCWQLFVGVMEWRPMLDARIEAVTENWTLGRMAPTDRNVLRIGAFELLYTDAPHRVVIDEAIELARLFGTANSPQFVNGILDKLVPAEKRGDKRTSEEGGRV
jgi:N utilization substance protein B